MNTINEDKTFPKYRALLTAGGKKMYEVRMSWIDEKGYFSYNSYRKPLKSFNNLEDAEAFAKRANLENIQDAILNQEC